MSAIADQVSNAICVGFQASLLHADEAEGAGVHVEVRVEKCRSSTAIVGGHRWACIGDLHVNGRALATGDALLIAQESALHLSQGQSAEVLVFDLAP